MASNSLPETLDQIIIGAGPIGILTALKFQKENQKVIVLERTDQLGGLWRTLVHEEALFEHGLHFVHHAAQWNEFLFEIDEEIPLTEPTEMPLLFEQKKWKSLSDLSIFTKIETPYLGAGQCLVRGGMSQWLSTLIEKKNLKVQFNESLKNLEVDDNGIIEGQTTLSHYKSQYWNFSGSQENYLNLFPPKTLKTHTYHSRYSPAIIFQFILKKPLHDRKSVHIIRHKMDHKQHTFFGLFESNLDPSRAPEGRQTCTWMCFLDEEEFEDTSAITRWRRALKRNLSHAWEDFENLILWERFLALPQAGGPQPRTSEPPKKLLHGHKLQWKNVNFLTHCGPHQEAPFFWTTQQLLNIGQVKLKKKASVDQTDSKSPQLS